MILCTNWCTCYWQTFSSQSNLLQPKFYDNEKDSFGLFQEIITGVHCY